MDLAGAASGKNGSQKPIAAAGAFEKACLCRSTCRQTRSNASSGGFVTQLLIALLEQKQIDGALVVMAGDGSPYLQARIARNPEQVIQATSSKYCLFPWGTALREVLRDNGRYAIVGTACQHHSLIKAAEAIPALKEKIAWTIGLFCAMNMEPSAVRHLMAHFGLSHNKVAALLYRKGPWPGGVYFQMKNGSRREIFSSHQNQGCQFVSLLKWIHGQERCLTCPDNSSQLTDFSVGDPWFADPKGGYAFAGAPGASLVLCRNRRAANLLEDSRMSQNLSLYAVDRRSAPLQSLLQRAEKHRKALNQIQYNKRAGKAVPDYGFDLATDGKNPLKVQIHLALFRWLHTESMRRLFLAFFFTPMGRAVLRWNRWLKEKRRKGGRIPQPMKEWIG